MRLGKALASATQLATVSALGTLRVRASPAFTSANRRDSRRLEKLRELDSDTRDAHEIGHARPLKDHGLINANAVCDRLAALGAAAPVDEVLSRFYSQASEPLAITFSDTLDIFDGVRCACLVCDRRDAGGHGFHILSRLSVQHPVQHPTHDEADGGGEQKPKEYRRAQVTHG
jgi:hypothetical protein